MTAPPERTAFDAAAWLDEDGHDRAARLVRYLRQMPVTVSMVGHHFEIGDDAARQVLAVATGRGLATRDRDGRWDVPG